MKEMKKIKGMFDYLYIDGKIYINTTKYYKRLENKNIEKFHCIAITKIEDIKETIEYFEKTFKMLEECKIQKNTQKEAKK